MKLVASILALLVLGLVGCEDSKESAQISPELSSQIGRIQTENGLSDEDLSEALERWVEMYSGAKELLESDGLFDGGAWTPERFADLMTESEKALKDVRYEDQMLAVYSLGHLSALNEERYEEAAESLRRIIARHCAKIEDDPNEVGENLLKRFKSCRRLTLSSRSYWRGMNSANKTLVGSANSASSSLCSGEVDPALPQL